MWPRTESKTSLPQHLPKEVLHTISLLPCVILLALSAHGCSDQTEKIKQKEDFLSLENWNIEEDVHQFGAGPVVSKIFTHKKIKNSPKLILSCSKSTINFRLIDEGGFLTPIPQFDKKQNIWSMAVQSTFNKKGLSAEFFNFSLNADSNNTYTSPSWHKNRFADLTDDFYIRIQVRSEIMRLPLKPLISKKFLENC